MSNRHRVVRDNLLRMAKLKRMKKCGIYKIYNKKYDKYYIGQSLNIDKRWYAHVMDLQNQNHTNKELQNDWTTIGENEFEFEIIEILDDPLTLLNREKHWIDYYQENNKIYNVIVSSTTQDEGERKSNTPISDFIDCKRIEQQRSMSWLAEELNVSYSTLRSRFKTDTLHMYDVINASRVLHFDLSELNALKEDI